MFSSIVETHSGEIKANSAVTECSTLDNRRVVGYYLSYGEISHILRRIIPILVYLAMFLTVQSASAALWYVDKDNASGTGDGASCTAASINEDKG
jgi:hypothetical protein